MIIYSGATSIGGRKSPNQDSYFLDPAQSLFSADIHFEYGSACETRLCGVFDGIGGGKAGDVASRTAAESFKYFCSFMDNFKDADPADLLLMAASFAHTMVSNRLKELFEEDRISDLSKEGCTLSAAIICPNGEYSIINIGDSPVFVVSDGEAFEVSRRHTVAMEKKRAGYAPEGITKRDRHVITAAIGSAFDTDVVEESAYVFDGYFLNDGDAIVITSDGVTEQLSPEEIAEVVSVPPQLSPKEKNAWEISAAMRLVTEAGRKFRKGLPKGVFGKVARKARRRLDNCSAVVLTFHEDD